MKILRSVTGWGFSVGSAGWFTVLKSNTWFAASRASGGFHYPSVRGSGAAGSAESRDARTLSLGRSGTREHRVVRSALIALAALVITSVLLLWIMRPR